MEMGVDENAHSRRKYRDKEGILRREGFFSLRY